MTAVLAADLGGTRLRCAVVSSTGRILARDEMPTRPEEGPERVVDRIVGGLRAVRDAAPAGVRSSIVGAVISGPGPLLPASGRLIDPILPFDERFAGLELARLVERAIGLPVRLDRDTVVAAMGEHAFGAARGERDFLYVTVSTGIGAAVFAAGRILRGADGLAGELGHVPVTEAGDPCTCGARGHLEAIAGGYAVGRIAEREAADGRSLALAAAARTGPLGAREVFAAAAAGDAVAIGIRDRATAVVAAASGFVNAFNPACLVLGGSIALAGGEDYLDRIREAIAAGSIGAAARRVRVVAAALGADAGLLGAVPLASTPMTPAL